MEVSVNVHAYKITGQSGGCIQQARLFLTISQLQTTSWMFFSMSLLTHTTRTTFINTTNDVWGKASAKIGILHAHNALLWEVADWLFLAKRFSAE